ncbi:MAG: hypothetical protein KKH74_06390 [Gammaproteobacteria bacterium]|nr:hypothetical protein [Gammaproteobacteria bacterium]MBU1732272.1 hypothetical protein [Gammaproteobacteria bacterium]MBU1893842.1 hypothetical protein [Gammaproteobacteria bacterium]
MDQTPTIQDAHAIELLGAMPTPEAVRQLEHHLLALPQVDLSTSHIVHGGMCARTIMIPAGTVLTGALTNIDNICVVHGDITVTTDKGLTRLTGFHVLPAAAGFKRAGVAHADTMWTTIWPTALEDIAAIEDEMTSESNMLQTRREGIGHEQKPALAGEG